MGAPSQSPRPNDNDNDMASVGNTMADHHRALGHLVTPGFGCSWCVCGHVWTRDLRWLDDPGSL